ncbi:MAG: peptidase [Gammaproteobacteria bacterium]|nr:peptidase [Gammaproteobacteria bacterium]
MRLLTLALVFALIGCGATIQSYEHLSNETRHNLSTHIGGQVLRIQRTSDLPNAFGKADIFGGKVNNGYTELWYQGLVPDDRVVFRITEVETESTETTMSRYGSSRSTVSAQRVGDNLYGTVTSYSAPSGSTERLPPNMTEFAVDPNKSKEFSVAGVTVRIINATETSLSYQLLK